MPGFGELVQKKTMPRSKNETHKDQLPSGWQSAIVKTAAPATDENGDPRTNDYGKPLVRITFTLDSEHDVARTYAVSYGYHQRNQTWAAWAEFLQAVAGIACGNPNQKKLGPRDLEGQRCRVELVKNDRGWMDVNAVAPPGDGDANATEFFPELETETPF